MMKVLFVGDVVGEPGRLTLYRALPELKSEYSIDAVVVNGENAAGGRGITPAIAHDFFINGVDVITLGDHVWDQAELAARIDELPTVLRPYNHQSNAPGCGSCVIATPAGSLGVLCLQGRTFMKTGVENPFSCAESAVESLRLTSGAQAIVVDFHAETTSEKIAMGRFLDGKVSAVLGTHTHVQTNDACLLPGGTAYLTDAGMCGPLDSVIGRSVEPVVNSFVTCMPRKFPVASWPTRLSGAVISIDETTGKALEITPLNRIYEK